MSRSAMAATSDRLEGGSENHVHQKQTVNREQALRGACHRTGAAIPKAQ